MADPCCPPNSIGPSPVLEVKNAGKFELINCDKPLRCYATGADISEAKRIVLICTDVYGVDGGRHKVFADLLAQKLPDTAVIIPDFFREYPIVTPYFVWWKLLFTIFVILQITIHCIFRITPKVLEEDLYQRVLPWLQKRSGKSREDLAISFVGFCFGGWQIGRVFTDDNPIFKCGVAIHPSFKVEKVHGSSPEKLAMRIRRPILFLPASNDGFKLDSTEVEIVSANLGVPREEVSIPFPTMIHGFVSRGDSNDPEIREQQERALALTVGFINKHHKLP